MKDTTKINDGQAFAEDFAALLQKHNMTNGFMFATNHTPHVGVQNGLSFETQTNWLCDTAKTGYEAAKMAMMPAKNFDIWNSGNNN